MDNQLFTQFTCQVKEKERDWTELLFFFSLSLAPDKVLDVWYLQEPKPPQSNNECFHIFWKARNPF